MAENDIYTRSQMLLGKKAIKRLKGRTGNAGAKRRSTGHAANSGKSSFCSSRCGMIMAGEIIKDLIKE